MISMEVTKEIDRAAFDWTIAECVNSEGRSWNPLIEGAKALVFVVDVERSGTSPTLFVLQINVAMVSILKAPQLE